MEHWQRAAVEVGQQEGADRVRRVKHGRKRRKNRKKYLLLAACILFLLAGSATILSTVLYQSGSATYHRSLTQARDGMQQMRVAEKSLAELQHNPFDVNAVNQARQAFVAAGNTFGQLQGTMQTVPGVSTLLPIYGPRIAAASHLVSLAVAAAQAGVAGCDLLHLLISRFHSPFQQGEKGLSMADFSTIESDFVTIRTAFALIEREASQVQQADVQFEPGLSQQVKTLQQNLPALQAWMNDIAQFLPALPALLGVSHPAQYLVEVLDSTELRPGGGFVGNYGVASLSGGRLLAARITDVDLLDRPFIAGGKSIAFPPQYQWFARALSLKSWSLRDSDLDADFPTAARYAEQNYRAEGGTAAFQGVIALTPLFMQQVMTITGPIAVPEYAETVTAQNLIARIHFHQLGPAGEGSDKIASPDGHSSLRKRFTELLAEHLLARVRQLPAPAQAKLVQVVFHAIQTKDIQIYFNMGNAEQILHQARLDAAIQSLPGDGLMVVDANVAGDKANSFIVNMLTDRVTIDAAGNAIHHTTLRYAWTIPGEIYGATRYRDYVRVYLPAGSLVQAQQGWLPAGESVSFGHKVYAGSLSLTYGQTSTVVLAWMSPHAARQDASGWHYQDVVQHQAGTRWQLHLDISLPACATIVKKQGGLVASNRRTALLNRGMDEDVSVEIDYSC